MSDHAEVHRNYLNILKTGAVIFILVVILLVGYQFFQAIMNNPLIKWIENIAGAAGVGLTDLGLGCCTQGACKETTSKKCNKSCGCGWDSDKGNCLNTSGLKEGQGGFWTCLYALGGLIPILTFGLYKVYAAVSGRYKKTAADDLARVNSEKVGDVISEWRANADVDRAKVRDIDKDYTKAERDYMESRAMQNRWNRDIVEPLKNHDAEAYKRQVDLAQQVRQESIDAAEISKDRANELDKDVEDATDVEDPIPHE